MEPLNVAISLSAALMLQAAPPSVTPESVRRAGGFEVEVLLPQHKPVGSRKAGLLCLPDGNFNADDFFPSEAYLKALIVGAFQESGDQSLQGELVGITFKKMKVSLCARDFLFNKREYSGTVSVEFEVSLAGNSPRVETFEFFIERGDPQSEAEITQRIAKELVAVLLNSRGAK